MVFRIVKSFCLFSSLILSSQSYAKSTHLCFHSELMNFGEAQDLIGMSEDITFQENKETYYIAIGESCRTEFVKGMESFWDETVSCIHRDNLGKAYSTSLNSDCAEGYTEGEYAPENDYYSESKRCHRVKI